MRDDDDVVLEQQCNDVHELGLQLHRPPHSSTLQEISNALVVSDMVNNHADPAPTPLLECDPDDPSLEKAHVSRLVDVIPRVVVRRAAEEGTATVDGGVGDEVERQVPPEGRSRDLSAVEQLQDKSEDAKVVPQSRMQSKT